MTLPDHRHWSGVVGGVIIMLIAGFVTVFGLPQTLPVTLQLGTLALAGILDILAVIDTRITDHIGWYRLTGLANICLGTTLLFSAIESGSYGGEQLLLGLSLAVGGLSLAGIGFDIFMFSGKHLYGGSIT